jgi:hypothetical protein
MKFTFRTRLVKSSILAAGFAFSFGAQGMDQTNQNCQQKEEEVTPGEECGEWTTECQDLGGHIKLKYDFEHRTTRTFEIEKKHKYGKVRFENENRYSTEECKKEMVITPSTWDWVEKNPCEQKSNSQCNSQSTDQCGDNVIVKTAQHDCGPESKQLLSTNINVMTKFDNNRIRTRTKIFKDLVIKTKTDTKTILIAPKECKHLCGKYEQKVSPCNKNEDCSYGTKKSNQCIGQNTCSNNEQSNQKDCDNEQFTQQINYISDDEEAEENDSYQQLTQQKYRH